MQVTQSKIKTLEELQTLLELDKIQGKVVVHCHGVFDLVHPGHIRHLNEAKKLGDILVVTITPDQLVNKGPGRPVFKEQLRLETLASLEVVDYVALNSEPTAITAIQFVQPNIYVKGIEYKEHEKDVTGKITEEIDAVEAIGGKVHYTEDITFSSSSLLNEHFDSMPEDRRKFLDSLKAKYSLDELIGMIDSFTSLKVLVAGDAIIDEYQFVRTLGQSGKGLHMTAECLDCETYAGGSFAVAKHVGQFSESVELLTAVGKECPHRAFIDEELGENIHCHFTQLEGKNTLTKKRFVLKDGERLSKLFETYSSNNLLMNPDQTEDLKQFFIEEGDRFDLVLIADFGNGFFGPTVAPFISEISSCIALNTQINSGNRGFNAITKYSRGDFVSLNEPELRLAMHDRFTSLDILAQKLLEDMSLKVLSVTRGVQGAKLYGCNGETIEVPTLSSHVIDRVGAGDSFLSIASLAVARGLPLELVGFFGALAGAIDVQIIGNKEPVHKPALLKFMTRLFK